MSQVATSEVRTEAGRVVRPRLWGRQAGRAVRPGVAVLLLALLLRLLHVRFTAKVVLADDAVFFEQHARRFLAAWGAVGQPEFGPALREAIDHASLQGIVYPLLQSVVYGIAGGVQHTPLLVLQAVLGAITAWLTYLTAARAFGQGAAVVAGGISAIYPPFVLTSGLLLAEAPLLALQALALYLLVRGLEPGQHWSRFLGGLCTGLLMLRPAFQYAGVLLFLALLAAALRAEFRVPSFGFRVGGRRGAAVVRWVAPYLLGVLLVAIPWLTLNGMVFGSFTWSRTGDAWQQIYWGIYPPNRGWWPPDSPVPPKYGVQSLPGARAAGMQIQTRDLDYLEAAVAQIRATPLKAMATEVNKLYQAWLHPFNNYAEQPVLVAALAVPLHRLLAILALAGLCLGWRRPAPSLVFGTALLAFGLPYLASHIDVRYTIPPAQIGAMFAGLAAIQLGQGILSQARAGSRRLVGLLAVLISPLLMWQLGVARLLVLAPGVAPLYLHQLHTALMVGAFLGAGWAGGRLVATTPGARPGDPRPLASGLLAGAILAAAYGTQAVYDGDWHEWHATLPAGGAVRQTFVLPEGWTAPAGSRAEVRLYLQGSPSQSYVPVVQADGQTVARLGPAFTDAGPLRFDETLMVSASRQGKTRADVPQWYAVPLEPAALVDGRVTVELLVEPMAGAEGAAGWIRVWGDYPMAPEARVYEGPAVHSPILGADNAFHKLVTTGHPMLWRQAVLASPRVEPAVRQGTAWREGDLSEAAGRQVGEYRIRLLVLGPNGELVATF